MTNSSATAAAHPNIAFIKYWGNRDAALRIPTNGSISMNLSGLETVTTVTFDPSFSQDRVEINGRPADAGGALRVVEMLDRVRGMAGSPLKAAVTSRNNFPTGAGIASSAAAFAALSLAASAAAGLHFNPRDLSRLARTGSGSACRSVPGGFVEWQAGTTDLDSYAFSIAPSDYWDLVDVIAVVSARHKDTGSSSGHPLAETSLYQVSRVADAPRRLDICRQAILARDFAALGEVIEADCNLMHAVMMTSIPPLFYWEPATLEIIHAVRRWRAEGIPAAYTIDAGPNVHVITTEKDAERVSGLLRELPGVGSLIIGRPGPGARLVEEQNISPNKDIIGVK